MKAEAARRILARGGFWITYDVKVERHKKEKERELEIERERESNQFGEPVLDKFAETEVKQ